MPHGSAWAPRVRSLTRDLVRIPSVTGTEGEVYIASYIEGLVAALPYFQAHPEHLRLLSTGEGRNSVVALVRGAQAEAQARTLILMGHIDTVPFADYGPLANIACDPDALAARPGAPAGFMEGRGSVDMKSGVAANLAILERFAAEADGQHGALLFLATPDEEDTSQGILSVLAALPALATEWSLDLIGAINTDYTAPRFPGDTDRYIYGGTIGKLMPTVWVVGQETHAGEPWRGFDPNLLIAEVVRRVSLNPAFCEVCSSEVTPPPVALKVTDTKEAYNVQIALSAWAYFTWFTFTQSAEAVLNRFRAEVEAAFASVLALQAERAQAWSALGLEQAPLPGWPVQVLTFAELAARVGESTVRREAARLAQEEREMRRFALALTERLWALAGLTAPAAVVGFAGVYYPPLALSVEAPLVQAASAAAAEFRSAYRIQTRRFFPYISDISFLGCPDSPSALAVLQANSPAWGTLYQIDHAAHARLNLPVINIGPWGEGAHTHHERVEEAYSFGVVPELIWQTVQQLFRL